MDIVEKIKGIQAAGNRMLLVTAKQYFSVNEEKRKIILKDLRGEWCKLWTNGKSIVVAEQLEHHPGAIKRKLKKLKEQGILD